MFFCSAQDTQGKHCFILRLLFCLPLQARKLAAYLKDLSANRNKLALEVAKVTLVQKVGMGDRCSLHSHLHMPSSAGHRAIRTADVHNLTPTSAHTA